jgi:anti-sigma regulatory factor (Ser/Thr protein kinase)/biotin operon repressor
MTRVRKRGEEIRKYILENVEGNRDTIGKVTAEHFSISRQAANKHLKRLAAEGALAEDGKTKGRRYRLAAQVQWQKEYVISPALQEDLVWTDDVSKVLGQMPENVLDIWQFGFTEMFNNAKDHSGGKTITVFITKTSIDTEMVISDDGVGIFRKIQAALGLLDERHAVFELAKGKLTTDPNHHSGEGIFFTSRMFDSFDIISGGISFSHQFGTAEDWILERSQPDDGTSVWLKLNNHTARTLKNVFDKYTSGDDVTFSKTIVPVKLAQYGNDKLISRSQAKRVLARVELFRTVIFDFRDVPSIGQAFADEIFRVFRLQHPDMNLYAINTNTEVRRMIARVSSENTEAADEAGSKETGPISG